MTKEAKKIELLEIISQFNSETSELIKMSELIKEDDKLTMPEKELIRNFIFYLTSAAEYANALTKVLKY